MENVTGIYVQDSKYSGLHIITIEPFTDVTRLVSISCDPRENGKSYHVFIMDDVKIKNWIKANCWIKFDEIESIEGSL